VRILLTGAAGFIGGAVDEALTGAGHDVVRVDAMLPQAHGAGAQTPAGVHRGDVRGVEGWAHLLTGVDAVCHQAAMVGAGVTAADLPLYAAHNDLGTAALLAAMAGAGVRRLVLASSMVVYGEGRYDCEVHGARRPGPRDPADLAAGSFDASCGDCGRPLAWRPVAEDAPIDPRSSYAASKVAQEHYAAAWARQTDAAVVALRYHNVYGPRMPRDTPYSGVAAIFRSQAERGLPPRVFEDGRQMRDFVHVEDVARANLLALAAVTAQPAGSVRAYNVCSGTPVDVATVARHVGGREPVLTGEWRSGDVRHVVASPERARAELGFTALVAPAAGLARFASDPLR
jgi:dTDP-L-rhamnose 4-epimerase